MIQYVLAVLLAWQSSAPQPNEGPLVHALWLIHAAGHADTLSPAGDRSAKAILAKSLTADREINYAEVSSIIDEEPFRKLAGKSMKMTTENLKDAAASTVPKSRKEMEPQIVKHLDFLTTTFDMLDEQHAASASQLAKWIADKSRGGEELHVIMVCTGNSRRSMLGSSLGNAAAAYYGFDRLHFHSGGTAPSAFNIRTISALTDMGFKIEATGREATRGEPKTANPTYKVTWGKPFSCDEFSKMYSDPVNPQKGFAAIMVCSEADSECPSVAGASLRISMPFVDPKIYDGSAFEKAKYTERRDDIARTLLKAICEARQIR